jgi:hypothetical protein
MDKIFEVIEQIKEINEIGSTLTEKQSEVDLEIADILHIIEFNTFNMKQAFQIIKYLKEKQDIRRKAKFDLRVYQTFTETHKLSTAIRRVENKYNACIENRPPESFWKDKKQELLNKIKGEK